MRTARSNRCWLWILASCVLFSTLESRAAPPENTKKANQRAESPGGAGVEFDLEDADLPSLVKTISAITGKRFIYGGKLRSIQATVRSPEKISGDEAYRAFLAILNANGMTVVPHGRFFKIIESVGAASQGAEVTGPSATVPDEARYVTHLHRLSNIDAAGTAAVLEKLKSKDGDITVHAPGNMLILTDTGANIRRMLQILAEIDVPGAGEQLWIQPLHHVGAPELSAKLLEVFDAPAGARAPSGKRIRILAHERANALLIVASEQDYRRVLAVIERLDVRPTAGSDLRVLPLRHAVCKELSKTIEQTIAGGAAPGAAGTVGAFDGRVKVSCDEAQNTIVASCSQHDHAELRALVDKLDRPRRQVFIEAIIMDVSANRSRNVGVSYHAGSTVDSGSSGQSVAYGGNNIASSIASVPSSLEGLVLGLRGPDIPGSQNLFGTGLSIPTFGMALSAVASDGDTNVLATPHILATDNVKAEISIGQNIPLQTEVSSGLSLAALAGQASSGASSALGSIASGGNGGQRQDVGTKITVTPHVNDSNEVRMELTEEISEAGAPLGNLGAIPIDKRAATTTLVVRDRQTVIIGGLVRDVVTHADTKIPVLGDIPLLGHLFRQSSTTKQKSNLLLVLTPYIVREPEDLRAIFERKMQERQDVIDRYLVFAGDAVWKPVRDFRRTNGLLEDIRQSMLAEELKREADAARHLPEKKVHERRAPVGAKPMTTDVPPL